MRTNERFVLGQMGIKDRRSLSDEEIEDVLASYAVGDSLYHEIEKIKEASSQTAPGISSAVVLPPASVKAAPAPQLTPE